jgi:hypothetical protein
MEQIQKTQKKLDSEMKWDIEFHGHDLAPEGGFDFETCGGACGKALGVMGKNRDLEKSLDWHCWYGHML